MKDHPFYVGAQFIEPDDNGFDKDTVEKLNFVAANFSLRKNMTKDDKGYNNFSPAKAVGYHFSTVSKSNPYKRK